MTADGLITLGMGDTLTIYSVRGVDHTPTGDLGRMETERRIP
jgi:hypothetical protein